MFQSAKRAYACAALFRCDSGTRGRLCLPLCILVIGSAIEIHESSNLYVDSSTSSILRKAGRYMLLGPHRFLYL